MLVLKIVEPKKRSLFAKRKIRNSLHCESRVIGSGIFYFVEISETDVNNKNVTLLLNKFKGNVLDTSSGKVNNEIKDYLFNPSAYIKRSILSSLSNYLRNSNEKFNLVFDDNTFRFSSEWIKVAKECKHICVNTTVNSDLLQFKEYCYSQLGVNVFINDFSLMSNFLRVNLNKELQGLCIDIFGASSVERIYADERYFTLNSLTETLTELGVSSVFACSAVQVIPFEKIYVT